MDFEIVDEILKIKEEGREFDPQIGMYGEIKSIIQ